MKYLDWKEVRAQIYRCKYIPDQIFPPQRKVNDLEFEGPFLTIQYLFFFSICEKIYIIALIN